MVSQERTTSSRSGRKRSNQTAELSDVSLEDDSKDDSMYHPGTWKKSGCDKGAETEDERQIRRISCAGRKRCSVKGPRNTNDDQTTTTTTTTTTISSGAVYGKSTSENALESSDSGCKMNVMPSNTTATTLHSSELRPFDTASTGLESSSSEATVHISNPAEDIDKSASITGRMDEDCDTPESRDDSGWEAVSGMPDWAAELDEVVPGVKVISIKDAVEVLLEYHQLDTPTSILFPWMHGIGDGPLGANGPLEQFFGNPPLIPPRYRGLSVLKAPAVSATAYRDRCASIGDMQPESRTSTDSADNQPSTSEPIPGCKDAASNHCGSRDRAASTSTFLSSMSSGTWDSTDSSDPSLYSMSSSPQSVTTVGTDYWGQSYDECLNGSTTSVETHGGCTADQDEGNAPGQPVSVAMHPTCAKTTLASDTVPKHAIQTNETAITERPRLETVEDVEMEDMEVELEVPQHISYEPYSPTGTETPQNTPPPTPQAHLSAHPTEENSILRTASGKGRVRSASPTLVDVPSQGRAEMLIRNNSDPTMYSGPEDAQVQRGEWSATAQHANQVRDQEALQNASSTCGGRCMLVNAIKTEDILDLDIASALGTFKKPDLGGEVSLRNLRIQEVKYGTISDLLLYSEEGLSDDNVRGLQDPLLRAGFSIARAQAKLYQERMTSFYTSSTDAPASPFSRPSDDFEETDEMLAANCEDSSANAVHKSMVQDLPDELEGQACSKEDVLLQLRDRDQWQDDHLRQRPVMYNVVIIKESFAEIQRLYPDLVAIDAKGVTQPSRDLWLKEAEESIKLAGASRLGENIWLGNGWDDPFRYPATLRNPLGVDLVIEAHDLADMPTEVTSSTLKQVLTKRLKPKKSSRCPLSSPRPQNLPAEEEPIYLEIASSCRARQCMQSPHEVLANRVIALADAVSTLTKPHAAKDKAAKVLVFCDDGYTETSVFALTYIMVSRRMSLREAYLHLQLTCKRSFFVYQFDVPFLSLVERKLAIRNAAIKQESALRPSSPLSKWKSFGLPSGRNVGGDKNIDQQRSEAVVPPLTTWIQHERFDGSFPSRILTHVYLGNIAHAMNSEMLRDLGITHVVSVGETLSAEGAIIHGHYVNVSGLTAHVGEVKDSLNETAIKVLEIQDVKDDGNDPLRPKIEHACEFIEQAGKAGGKTLIHCRVGVSRSASIVVAYLIKYEHKTLLDAYLMTRCRRLNVLIQPNLKFLHELLGWEVETRAKESRSGPAARIQILQRYSWPSLCRDLWLMNKKYLVPGDAC